MRAIVKTAAGPGMQVRDVPVPSIGASDVLIRVLNAGVCGTDLHIWEWDAWAAGRLKPPVTIGHEFSGRIEKLGGAAESEGILKVGDLVTAEGHIICGHCLPCRTGNGHLCVRTRIIGVDRDGAFADYIAMPVSNVMLLDGISPEIGAIMDPVGNAVTPFSRAVKYRAARSSCWGAGRSDASRSVSRALPERHWWWQATSTHAASSSRGRWARTIPSILPPTMSWHGCGS